MPAKRRPALPLPADLQAMMDDMTPVPALTDEDIDPLQLLIDAPAEDFLKALSLPMRKLVVEGLRMVPVPRNLKELASVYQMFTKVEGLDKKEDKSPQFQGFVVPLRSVKRRIGGYPEPAAETPSLLEIEAEYADQGAPPPEDEFEV